MKEPTKRNVRKGYWIKATIYYCPVCCGERTYKERVYDQPKPIEWELRNHVVEYYDYCDG